MSETAMYRGIISVNPVNPKIKTTTALKAIRIYLPSLPLNLRSGNLSESNGILVTINNERIRENNANATGIERKDFIIEASPYSPARAIAVTARAFAGVGNPLKIIVCVLSRLNFASLKPAHTGMMHGTRNAKKDSIPQIDDAEVTSGPRELLRRW